MALKQNEFSYVKEAVGALVLFTLSIFLFALFQAERLGEWFDPGANLTIVLPKEGIFGLAENADVEVLGTKAGEVRSIIIDPSQRIHAVVRVRRAMQDFVRSDSLAVIRKRFGVAGETYLEISRGVGPELDWSYAVLEATADRNPTESVGDLIEEFRAKVTPVIEEAGRGIHALTLMAEQLYSPEGEFQRLFVNLNDITGTIVRGEGALGYLLARDDLVQALEITLARLNADLGKVEPILDDLHTTVARIGEQSTDIPILSEQAKSVLGSLDAVLVDLRETTPDLPRISRNVSEATEELPVLIAQTRQTALELERLLGQLRSNWLLGGGSAAGQNAPAGSARIRPLEVKP